uniref:DUF1772 domain-containing protein n=1 Tax=Panagrolaimus davidi TaxID=227884 RepID=A0A914PCI8_9BILA
MLFGQLALIDASLCTGGLAIVSHAESPARLKMDDDRLLLIEFQETYPRAAQMQAPLSIIGGILGFLHWLIYGGLFWLFGTFFMSAIVLFTVVAIMPINKQLMAMSTKNPVNSQSRKLIIRWGELHFIRTCFGFAAVLSFLIASLL